jgi:hypothetical protein
MKLLFISIVSVFIFSSCGGEEESGDSVESSATISNTEESNEEDALALEVGEELEGLQLNVGEKWDVDSSTAAGMIHLQELIDNFDGEDSEALGKEMNKTLKDISKNCTMKGEDHDQYHIVLKAMKKESKQLKKGKSTDPSKMQRYLEAYNAHFH